jgi:nucleotide-binding universal stress UspA family protein
MTTGIRSKKAPNESIVVPLDGSKLAEVALPYAEELGARTGNDIALLTVLEFASNQDVAYLRRIINATKRHAEKYLVIPGSKEINVSATTSVGNPARAIVDYACTNGHKLIVMATHGRSGIGRWALGSIADKVVRAPKNLPVMLIRGRKARPDVRQKRLLRKALVPLDGSILSQTVVPYISRLALKLQMSLTLFQVVPQTNNHKADAESYLQAQCAELERQGIAAEYRVQVGSPADAIIELADELLVDLVAMSTHGRTGFPFWTIGSVAQKVLLAGNTPLLLLRCE